MVRGEKLRESDGWVFLMCRVWITSMLRQFLVLLMLQVVQVVLVVVEVLVAHLGQGGASHWGECVPVVERDGCGGLGSKVRTRGAKSGPGGRSPDQGHPEIVETTNPKI